MAIGGPNALKSPVLFLKVFQVTHDKTVTSKVSLNFHFFLSRAIEDSFQESKSFELEFEIPVACAPVV